MKKYTTIALALFASWAFVGAQINAEEVGDVANTEMQCTVLTYSLKLRSKDSTTNNEVTALQEFLQDSDLLDADPSGYFGNATLKAVKAFQKQNGLIASGLVGPYTRKAIQEKSCNQTSTTPIIKKETVVKETAVACTMEYRACSDGSAMPREANCVWREDKCSTTSDVKKGETETGDYIGYLNDQMFIKSVSVTKQYAYNNCKINYNNNPTKSIKCTWKGVEIYSTKGQAVTEIYKPKVEAHGPGANAMSCASPSSYGLANGQVGCYGIWDYGNEFGGDPDMCPQYGYPKGELGCIVKTPSCNSGQAVASKMVYPVSMDVNSSEIVLYAKNLKSTTDAVKQQIPTLWEYTCTGDSASVGVVTGQPVATQAVPSTFTVTPGSELHVIGVYEASNDHSFCHSSVGNVSVKVRNTGKPVVLALSSYEPVNWNVSLEQGATLERVIVAGYGTQVVQGISSSVPVNSYTYHSYDKVTQGGNSAGAFYDSNNRNGKQYHWASKPDVCPESASVPESKRMMFTGSGEYYMAYKKDGESYQKWVNKLKTLTGLPVSSFQGGYNATSFTVTNAQSYGIVGTPSVLGASTMCTRLYRNMHRGDESEQTKMLQGFLSTQGLFNSDVTGFYGDKTVEAVKLYQKNKALNETGMVYNATRGAIEGDSCR